MTAFKELVEADRARVFLSPDDFGEEHTVDGVLLACVLDTDVRSTRAPELGVESGDVRLFAAAEEIGDRREAGDVMDVDGVLYTIASWQEDMGMAQVSLSSARCAY